MPQEKVVLYNPVEADEELVVNVEKIVKTIWSRRILLIKVFCSVLVFFILLTFVLPKKYKVTADLYINKSNSSNMMEFNPYVLDEASGAVVSMGTDKAINNEIELMKSSLVLDDVIKDNNLRYKKGKKKGEYISAKVFYGKGKKLKIDNIKNTNVISIEYKAKNPELAYGVVSSLIANYIELHKELNTEKSKTDKKLIESEYEKAKENLNKKLNQSTGLPVQSISGLSNLSAMSAFSKSASDAMQNVLDQYMEGERSQIALTVESQKLNQLATKLEWAKMVEQMSDSSKVLVINEPELLKPYENTSPNLIINIILGILVGGFAVLSTLILVELTDKKLSYSMLTNNIIFDGVKNIDSLKAEIFSCNPKKILLIPLVQISGDMVNSLQSLSNTEFINPDFSNDFLNKVSFSDKIILISKISETKAEFYKTIRRIIKNQGKDIYYDVLV